MYIVVQHHMVGGIGLGLVLVLVFLAHEPQGVLLSRVVVSVLPPWVRLGVIATTPANLVEPPYLHGRQCPETVTITCKQHTASTRPLESQPHMSFGMGHGG